MTSNLSSEALELRRQYLREWRKRHPEKVKGYNRSYWERQAEKKRGEEDAENEAGR